MYAERASHHSNFHLRAHQLKHVLKSGVRSHVGFRWHNANLHARWVASHMPALSLTHTTGSTNTTETLLNQAPLEFLVFALVLRAFDDRTSSIL